MLVISRSVGQRVMIGDNIVITVVQTGDRVRLGIDAPKDVLILREELAQQSTQLAVEPPEAVAA
jgi:carbon storage regulator